MLYVIISPLASFGLHRHESVNSWIIIFFYLLYPLWQINILNYNIYNYTEQIKCLKFVTFPQLFTSLLITKTFVSKHEHVIRLVISTLISPQVTEAHSYFLCYEHLVISSPQKGQNVFYLLSFERCDFPHSSTFNSVLKTTLITKFCLYNGKLQCKNQIKCVYNDNEWLLTQILSNYNVTRTNNLYAA